VENRAGHSGYKHLVGVEGACSVGLLVVRAAAAEAATEAAKAVEWAFLPFSMLVVKSAGQALEGR